MPVRKYRSVAEMPGVEPGRPLHPDNLGIACALNELVLAFHAPRIEPGVRKYRSVEEADRARREAEKQRVQDRLA